MTRRDRTFLGVTLATLASFILMIAQETRTGGWWAAAALFLFSGTVMSLIAFEILLPRRRR